MTVTEPTEVFVSLMQSDGRLDGRLPVDASVDAAGEAGEEVPETTADVEDDDGGGGGGGGGAAAAPVPAAVKSDPMGPINHSIRFVVVRKPRRHHTRVWELDPSEIVADSDASTFANKFPQREVTKGSIQLDPRFTCVV